MKNQPFIVANQYNEREYLQNGFAGLLFFGMGPRKAAKEIPGRLEWSIPAWQRSTFFFVGEGQRRKYQKRNPLKKIIYAYPSSKILPWQPPLLSCNGWCRPVSGLMARATGYNCQLTMATSCGFSLLVLPVDTVWCRMTGSLTNTQVQVRPRSTYLNIFHGDRHHCRSTFFTDATVLIKHSQPGLPVLIVC